MWALLMSQPPDATDVAWWVPLGWPQWACGWFVAVSVFALVAWQVLGRHIEACKGAFDVQQAMLRDLFRVVSRDARTKKPDA